MMRGIAVMVEKKYPSDLTDEEWEILKELLDQEKPSPDGRPAEVDYTRLSSFFLVDFLRFS